MIGVIGVIGVIGKAPITPLNLITPIFLSLSPLKHKKSRSPWMGSGAGREEEKNSLSLFYYTSSGDSQRKETMLNFLPNALFTALSSVSSSAPLFMLIFLTGVSGLSTGST